MPTDPDVALGKRLSYVLRHRPDSAGLELDPHGWLGLDALVAALSEDGPAVAHADVERIAAASDKRRFELSDDGRRIRAAQVHSVAVDLGLPAIEPPTTLYHGTATRFVESILASGLRPGSRRSVHLSGDVATARAVGARHGRPVVLRVAAGRMHAAGAAFRRASNGVWLTDRVEEADLEVGESADEGE